MMQKDVNVLSDKEVGEIWRNCHESLDAEKFRMLIRKLVEEVTEHNDGDLGYVLDRFSIDPATWEEK